MVADVSHLYRVVDDRQENYDELLEATRHAQAQASERLARLGDASDSDHASSDGDSRRRGGGRRRRLPRDGGSHSRDVSNQEEKQNWARMKEEELIDRMLSQFPVSVHV
jgi:hypothetical protein